MSKQAHLSGISACHRSPLVRVSLESLCLRVLPTHIGVANHGELLLVVVGKRGLRKQYMKTCSVRTMQMRQHFAQINRLACVVTKRSNCWCGCHKMLIHCDVD